MLNVGKQIKKIVLLSTILVSPALFAVPIPAGLDISGSLTNTQADAFGGATTTSSAITGGTTSSASLGLGGSIAATFSDTGDGLGFDGSVSGSDTDGVTYAGFGNYYLLNLLVGMNNTSANDYRIIWDFSFDLNTDADGADAFGETSMNVSDTLATLFSELFISDVFLGDQVGNTFPPTSGAALGTSGSTSFSFDILAGNSASLTGALGIGGGVFATASSFLSDLDFDLRIRSIEQLNTTPGPNPIPEPFSLSLFMLGLIMLLRNKFLRQIQIPEVCSRV
eukprot:TRINITY_DN6160_c1_g1_i3.p1 TRINITY_DN6160_c1_g1~~TRINITY_DN6160_c1_g1_i3.p1  ORF type:complete len:280 (+),score=8.60 TRINITY_DN6160_c1_g1_i3:69-908(+)